MGKTRGAGAWLVRSGVLLAAAILLAGCGTGSGGDGGDDDNDGNGSHTAVTQAVECAPAGSYAVPADQPGTPYVAQTLPQTGVTDVDPAHPVIVFFSDAIDPASVDSTTFQVVWTSDSGVPIPGTFCFNTTGTGETIVIFSGDLPANARVDVTVSTGVQDPGGAGLDFEEVFHFETGTGSGSSATLGDLDFELGSLPAGVRCAGDCAVLSAFGDAPPVGGYAAYISSSESSAESFETPLLSETPALFDQTSILSIAGLAVPDGVETLTFAYDFISDEFPEFVDSEFDDHLMVAVAGPEGATAGIATSVNLIGRATTPGSFPGMPVDSDVTEHTGRRTLEVNVGGLGSPITVFLIVSDVADDIYPTVVMLDAFAFD